MVTCLGFFILLQLELEWYFFPPFVGSHTFRSELADAVLVLGVGVATGVEVDFVDDEPVDELLDELDERVVAATDAAAAAFAAASS